MIYYLCVNTQYIYLKQKVIKKQYQFLLKRISLFNHKTKNIFVVQSQNELWTKFINLNTKVFLLHKEISAHSKFWKTNLTVFYLIYLVNSSYYAYAIFNDDVTSFSYISKIYFAIITFKYLFMLVFVTWQCSKIVLLNCRIHKITCKLGVKFSRVCQLNFHKMMTIDAITAESRNVKKVTFKLFNNYRVDIQMFEVLLTYSTTIFLMVFGRQ